MTAAAARPTRSPRRTPRLDVVTFGEILWDIYETSPRGDEPIGRTFRRELGGALANVATDVARLGLRAAVVGGVGRDAFGEALRAHLGADGVDTRFVLPMDERTGIAFVSRDDAGEPSFMFYRHETADMAVRASHITPEMGHARWALVGTSTSMDRPRHLGTEAFLAAAEQGGACRVVDLNVRAHLWSSRATLERVARRLVRGAAIVKASENDLRELAGRRGLAWLEAHAPHATWIVTRGQGPATAIGAHGEVSVPAKTARCIDATGAGDAFLAGCLATLCTARAEPGTAAWEDPDVFTEALAIGHALGAKAVSKAGSVTGITGLAPLRARLARLAKARKGSRTGATASASPARKSRTKKGS